MNGCNLVAVRKLGEGGYGIVFEVQDVTTKKKFAYKTFFEENGIVASLKEIDVLFRIKNKYLVPGSQLFTPIGMGEECILKPRGEKNLSYGETGGFLMNLAKGEIFDQAPLFHKFLNSKRINNPNEKASIGLELTLLLLLQMLSAVKCLQDSNYYHRDIKPENILWTVDPVTEEVTFYLSDYGLVYPIRSVDEVVYNYDSGTPSFYPPEYYYDNERLDSGNDIYALGVTILSMLVGHENDIVDAPVRDKKKNYLYPQTVKKLQQVLQPEKIEMMLTNYFASYKLKERDVFYLNVLKECLKGMLEYNYNKRWRPEECISYLTSQMKMGNNPLLAKVDFFGCTSEMVVFKIENKNLFREGVEFLLSNYLSKKIKYVSLALCTFVRLLNIREDPLPEKLIKECYIFSRIFHSTSSSTVDKLQPEEMSSIVQIVMDLRGRLFIDPIYFQITSFVGLRYLFNNVISDPDSDDTFVDFLNFKDIGIEEDFFDQEIFDYQLAEILK